MVWVVRHAQSTANAGGRTKDPTGITITSTGRLQAECVAEVITEAPARIVVSPYTRTRRSAGPLQARFPQTPVETWPIHEFTYLDNVACIGTTYQEREELRRCYWNRCDPDWIDGPGCESFAAFISRVQEFRERILRRDNIVVFGHGLFIQALISLQQLSLTMDRFNTVRRSVLVANCAMLNLSTNQLSTCHLPADLITY